jgi:hypothetical protein
LVVVEAVREYPRHRAAMSVGAVPPCPASMKDEEWARRLQAWVETHPSRPIAIDDGRESLYDGRGE